MATAITSPAIGAAASLGYWDGQPSNRNSFADQSWSGTAVTYAGCTSTFVSSVYAVRALLNQKMWFTKAGTFGPYFQLQVSNSSTFATLVRTIGHYQFDRVTSCGIITGVVADGLEATFARILIDVGDIRLQPTGSDFASFDCLIDAT